MKKYALFAKFQQILITAIKESLIVDENQQKIYQLRTKFLNLESVNHKRIAVAELKKLGGEKMKPWWPKCITQGSPNDDELKFLNHIAPVSSDTEKIRISLIESAAYQDIASWKSQWDIQCKPHKGDIRYFSKGRSFN